MHSPAGFPASAVSRSDHALASSTVLSSTNSLPNETLIIVFHDLSPADLASVARVCRQWRAVAEWLMYTNIFISESLSPSSHFPYNTARCCLTIASHPRLASGLRKFHIRWISDHADHYSDPRFGTALSHLSSAISLSKNLESLDLYLGLPSHPDCPIPGSLCLPSGDTVLHSLRYISLSAVGYLAHGPLLQLLRNLPSIQHLRLPDYRDQLSLHPHALPSLTCFCGSPRAAATVLPGRPVQSLALVGQDYVTELDLSQMARTSVPLQHLDLSAMSVTPILLRNVSRSLSMVQSLKVKLALRHTLHFALSGIRLLAALSHLLGAFDRLSILDLSPTHVDYTGLSNAVEELLLCQSWQNTCPSLRRIVFPSRTTWTYHTEEDVWMSSLAEVSRRRPAFYASSPVTVMQHMGP